MLLIMLHDGILANDRANFLKIGDHRSIDHEPAEQPKNDDPDFPKGIKKIV